MKRPFPLESIHPTCLFGAGSGAPSPLPKGEGRTKKMLKMKVDPAMCMKTKERTTQ
jgi:hypothetical protein